MKKIITAFLLLISILTFGQSSSRQAYINKYKDLAIREMKRSGIPSSITLAQGLLESGNGKSTLAIKAKNHFGIKCHKGWRGPFIRMHDDKPNEKFRKYKRVEDSYRDHSDFLTGKQRYASLFRLNPKDYKGWARGLKAAGYATARDYARKLIKIIEDEDLHKFDDSSYKGYNSRRGPSIRNVLDRRVEVANTKPYLTIIKGDSFHTISQHFNISVSRLRKFNDMASNQRLKPGQRLYVKRKRRRAASGYDYHLVREGDTPISIAQKYAMKVKLVYKFNRLRKGIKLTIGERIYLRGKAPKH
ncbi:MAG: glucosaminidase domain-containing protein [Marinifilaceae bacterium]